MESSKASQRGGGTTCPKEAETPSGAELEEPVHELVKMAGYNHLGLKHGKDTPLKAKVWAGDSNGKKWKSLSLGADRADHKH